MAQDPPTPTLKDLRDKLDGIDEEMVRLLARRQETVGAIVKDKAERPQGIRDPERERQVLARVEALAQSLGVSGPLARKLFSEIIEHSVSRQTASLSGADRSATVTVAYQGAPLTYNHFAAQKYVG